jgi:hypothetical protein
VSRPTQEEVAVRIAQARGDSFYATGIDACVIRALADDLAEARALLEKWATSGVSVHSDAGVVQVHEVRAFLERTK